MSTSLSTLSENDLDTVLFTVFEIFKEHLDGNWTVNLCNPPGGDWSRFLLEDRKSNIVYTWNTLPRVRGENKLPDFVVQHHSLSPSQNIVYTIESKDRPTNLEPDIGPRMNDFVLWLINDVPASLVTGARGKGFVPEKPSSDDYCLCGCVATSFLPDMAIQTLARIKATCNCSVAINMYRKGHKLMVGLTDISTTPSQPTALDLLKGCIRAVEPMTNIELEDL
jgi:hypothetical protein